MDAPIPVPTELVVLSDLLTHNLTATTVRSVDWHRAGLDLGWANFGIVWVRR